MFKYEFFENGEVVGVQRDCADGTSVFGCFTDAYREEYRCFVKDKDEDEASFYIESDPFENPFDAFYDMDLKMPQSLVEYGDQFFDNHDSDEYALAGAMREHNLY